MFKFYIVQHVPEFILRDKNGYALARAIEAAIKYINDHVKSGVDTVIDVGNMPEWRLDEMAWELNCLYDFNADIDTKRIWIRDAIPLYRLYGTVQAIRLFLGGYFDEIEVEESWVYNGSPYHFSVLVDGEWTPENEAWAIRAIESSKNVRSVLDELSIGCSSYLALTGEIEVAAKFAYPLTGPENWAGRWPQENCIGVLDEGGRIGAEGEALAYKFGYPMAGTRPEINTIGVLDDGGKAGISGEASGYLFDYPMTSESINAGTIPQDNTIGEISENNIQSAQAEDTYATILYKMCGMDEI